MEVRITGGKFRGRRLKSSLPAQVRPTQDAVREALFSMLFKVIPQSVFVDLFAGTGIVGLEALSRGARSVTWVETDRKTARELCKNLESITGEAASAGSIAVCDALTWLSGKSTDAATVIYADPPYGAKGEADLTGSVLAAAAAGGRIASGAVFVVEQRDGSLKPEPPKGWKLIDERHYGRTRLLIYRVPQTAGDTNECGKK